MRRKWLVQLLAMMLVLALVGCSTASPQGGEPDSSSKTEISTDTEVDDSSETEETVADNTETTVDDETEIIEEEPEDTLNETQKNSIAMLNYLAFLSQEVNSSKNSRMFLEEAYASLINNTNPEKVNELTESHLSSLLDIIEKYRMVNVKRERLQYLYDQNKAQAIRQAMPNPIALLSATNSRSLKQLAASAIYMAVDSVNSYKSYNDELDSQFLQDGWALDDEEDANLHDSRKRAFLYMIEIVREEGLPEELTLNEKAVEDFVKCKNNSNNMQRIQFLESEEETYSAFGNYWLLLSECYYQNGDYEKCLEAIAKYEKLEAEIFRKDYYLAQTLPNAIVAASEVYSFEQYVPVAEKYLELLMENTENTEWSLRTFVAQIYMDIYAQTGNKAHLEKAYDITLNNVNYLVGEQVKLNEQYMADVKEVKVSDDATKDEKKQIKDYNKQLNETRETELPPVYEPLKINCEMLFAVADELDIADSEKVKIDGILNASGAEVFMTDTLQNLFTFSPVDVADDAKFDKDTLVLPANLVATDSVISVTVTEGGKTATYTDWKVKKVEREADELESFEVTYTSKKIKDQDWSKKTTVKVEIFDVEGTNHESYVLEFKAKEKKTLGVIKSIVFEQVK